MTDPTHSVKLPLDVEQIQDLLPHRYPFLLVDRVIDVVPGQRIVALKNVSINEPCFAGHFPGHPIMPGVLIVEAMAQAAGVLVRLTAAQRGDHSRPLFYLVKVDRARFSAMVVPGDQLRMEVSIKRMLRGMGVFEGRAFVGDKEVASCELVCAGRND